MISWRLPARSRIVPVDPTEEYVVQQLKEFYGKKLKAVIKEGFDAADKDKEKRSGGVFRDPF